LILFRVPWLSLGPSYNKILLFLNCLSKLIWFNYCVVSPFNKLYPQSQKCVINLPLSFTFMYQLIVNKRLKSTLSEKNKKTNTRSNVESFILNQIQIDCKVEHHPRHIQITFISQLETLDPTSSRPPIFKKKFTIKMEEID
jgi:hypothetical protein